MVSPVGARSVAVASGAEFVVRLSPELSPSLYLAVSGASREASAGLVQRSYRGDGSQRWRFRPADRFFEIINDLSGMCLTTNGAPGDQVYQAPCDGQPRQKWDSSIRADQGAAGWIRGAGSDLAVGVNAESRDDGATIVAWHWGGGANEFFLASKT
jgi:hypothetical protein